MTDIERKYLEDHGWKRAECSAIWKHGAAGTFLWRDPLIVGALVVPWVTEESALRRQRHRDAVAILAADQGGFPRPIPAWSEST